MKKKNIDDKKRNYKLDWQKYDWREFEEICFEYIKEVYSAEFYKTELTRAQKDKGRDIVIKGKFVNFEAWGECKNHKRNVDLSTIGKNVVLALSHQINKAIFFSATNITLNTKTEILNIAQKQGFEVLFLDGEILDETILSCRKVAFKYFRKEYEKYIIKNKTNIWIESFLSEYPCAEDAPNNTKIQYHLHNGFRVYLHIFIKNMRRDSIINVTIRLKNINDANMIFYETTYEYNNIVCSLSDLMHTFSGLVFAPQKNILLPNVEVICKLENGNYIHRTITIGEIDASDIWKAPYINTASKDFMKKTAEILQKIIPQGYVRLFYLYGNSGTGKSRLMNEIENKTYENLFRVIHIDFREKTNITALQDFIIALLGLPSSKHKINISLSEFIKIFKTQIEEEPLRLIYNFLYQEQRTISNNQLVNAIIAVIVNTSENTPTLVGLDNIQELSKDYQIIFWSILEYCRTISLPICFVLSHNTERNSNIKHVLVEYLISIGEGKEDYISIYRCDALSMPDAVMLMQQLLHIPPESEKYIEQILQKNGTLPMDILLLAKDLSQEDKLFNKTGENNYIINPHLLLKRATLLSVSTKFLIENRIKNMSKEVENIEEYCSLFALICHFDGNLPTEIYEECKFDEKILYITNSNLITKVNYKENLITFYHEKFFSFFIEKQLKLSSFLLKTVCKCYTTYNNENIISAYHYVKTLIALKEKNAAIEYGIAALGKYSAEHQSVCVSRLCTALLEIIDPITEPIQYFKILFLQADIWLENINFSEAENLFEEAYNIMKEKYSLFTPEDIIHFFHRYINQKLHTLQYDKALILLEEFESHKEVVSNASMIIDDRYCVALYSLGLEKEALEKINCVIEYATQQTNYTWLSIAYSDKAFTYFFNSKDIDNIILNFKKAITYFSMCDEKDSISRRIEIATQSTIVHILEKDIKKAVTCIQNAIYEAEKNSYGYLLIPTLNLYMYILMLQGKIEEATSILNRALSYANIFSNEKALISLYNNLGNIYIEKSMYNKALEYYKVSYDVLKRQCKSSNSLRYRGLICNVIKHLNYLHNTKSKHDLLDHYEFKGLENYTFLNPNSNNCIDIATDSLGILNLNGADYLYY